MSFRFDAIDLLVFTLWDVGMLEFCCILSLVWLDCVGGDEDFLNTNGDNDLGDDPTDPPVDRIESLDIRLRVDFNIDAVPLVLSASLESFIPFDSWELLSPFMASFGWSIVDIVVHDADIPSEYGGDVPLILIDVSCDTGLLFFGLASNSNERFLLPWHCNEVDIWLLLPLMLLATLRL